MLPRRTYQRLPAVHLTPAQSGFPPGDGGGGGVGGERWDPGDDDTDRCFAFSELGGN